MSFDVGQVLERALRRCLERRAVSPQGELVLAWSGGRDSTALAHMLARLRQELTLPLRAVHIHHGMQAPADDWVRQVRQQAEAWHLPLKVHHVQVSFAASREDQARRARQSVWAQELRSEDILLLAHHAGDQAETLLFRLFRGTGLDGLAAMAVEETWTNPSYRIWRPWLDQSRQLITAYLREQGIAWSEDASNSETHFDRNYLRHEILPRIEARWPQAQAHLVALAEEGHDERFLRQEQVHASLAAVMTTPSSLAIEALQRLPATLLRRVLRAWLQESLHLVPSRDLLARLESLSSSPDAGGELHWRGWRFVRTRTQLSYAPIMAQPWFWPEQSWRQCGDLQLPDGGRLCLERVQGGGLRACVWEEGLSVRQRQGGERLLRRDGERQVKKLLQTSALPAYLRAHMPLLYAHGRLVGVPGLAVAADVAAAPDEYGYHVHWIPPVR